MLKRFFMAFLGSLAAIWFTALLAVILMFSIIGLVMSSDSDSGLKDHSILKIDLTGTVEERTTMPKLSDIALNGYEPAQSLEELLLGVKEAAENDKIDGIFIECGGAEMGYASREELVTALREFKKSGKWIYAYGEAVSQGDYYVASVADKIFLNPSGMVDVRGMASQIPFFKEALDKLGVEMQVTKVGTYKSAVEPFIMTEPSEASKLQTHVFLDAIWGNVTKTIAQGRGVKATAVNAWADSLIVLKPASTALDLKVVSELKYRRQVDDALREKTGLEADDEVRYVSVSDFLSQTGGDLASLASASKKGKKHIAVYYAFGDIADSGSDGIIGPTVTADIVKLADDDNVGALVLRVNSGGGSAFASEQIWESLDYFKSKGKPFYVSMGDYAASGGYYISCGADRIYADPNTLTGSIGIFGMIPCAHDLLKDKIGVNFATIATNPNGSFPNFFEPMNAEQRQAMQAEINEGYRLFTKRVADGRKLPIDSVLTIAEGRVWDGGTALRIGLVDELGGLDAAIAAIAEKSEIDAGNTVSYPVSELNSMQLLMLQLLNENAQSATPLLDIDGMDAGQTKAALRRLRTIQNMGRIQARMEDITLY